MARREGEGFMLSEKIDTLSPSQQELNLIRLKLEIEEQQKRAAKARAFKAAEDAKWDRIKKERARKKLLRESKGLSGKPVRPRRSA
jgi:hypothetical protein